MPDPIEPWTEPVRIPGFRYSEDLNTNSSSSAAAPEQSA